MGWRALRAAASGTDDAARAAQQSELRAAHRRRRAVGHAHGRYRARRGGRNAGRGPRPAKPGAARAAPWQPQLVHGGVHRRGGAELGDRAGRLPQPLRPSERRSAGALSSRGRAALAHRSARRHRRQDGCGDHAGNRAPSPRAVLATMISRGDVPRPRGENNHGQERRQRRLSRHRGDRHQLAIVGRRRKECREDRGEHAARSAHRRDREARRQDRERQGGAVPRAPRALVQVRRVMFTAVVRITGAGRLADFRERLRWLLVRDPEAEDYTEHHEAAVLEYRFTPKKGIPFPALTEASGNFPELRVEAQWDHDGVRGRAVIENGRLVEEQRAEPASAGVEIAAGDEGRLDLALICEREDGGWIGYAATAERHTYFRYRDGRLELVDPSEADDALEDVAFRLVDEWIWYDEEEAPTERARYAQYGYPVRGANLKSEKLALLRQRAARYSTLDTAGAEVREALIAQWLNRA